MTELQIRYFFTVANHLSFSNAAKELYVSQPSVSRQISDLEEELGFPLFNRVRKNKIELTPAGRIFYDGMMQSDNLIKDTISLAYDTSKYETVTARIGMVTGWRPLEIMNKTIRRCEEAFPKSEISFVTDSFKGLRQGLQSDEYDAILSVITSLGNTEHLSVKKIADLQSVMFFSKNHVLQTPGKPQLSDFMDDIYYVLPPDESPLSRDINHGFFIDRQLQLDIKEKPNRDSVFMELLFGRGFTIYDNWTSVESGLMTLPLDYLPISIGLAEKKNKTNPLVEIFIEEVLNYVSRQLV